MRFFYLAFMSLFCFTPAWASVEIGSLLNKVTLQLTAEQWVSTKTALVTIGINASVSDTGVEKLQSVVLDKLNRIAKGEWHLISFDRSLDKSGLERIQISAQARLSDSELSGLRDKAKAVSKPGETYTLDNVEFTPSEEEVREASTHLREQIYQQAQQELTRLNKLYPEQKYTLHDMNFLTEMMPVAAAASNNVMYGANNKAIGGRVGLAVGDKLRLSATVVLSTSIDPNLIKR